jgi:DNA-binding GntR family transcriptional regulator
VFEARRLVEPAVLRRLVDRADAGQGQPAAPALAWKRTRAGAATSARDPLSGEFHTLAAELAGNSRWRWHRRNA